MNWSPLRWIGYNNSIHSVTNNKPADLFFDRSARINYQGLTNFRTKALEGVRGMIEYRQEFANAAHNKTRKEPLLYNVGDKIFVANKQIKTKEKQRFKAEEIAEDRRVTVKTKKDKILHKSDLRNGTGSLCMFHALPLQNTLFTFQNTFKIPIDTLCSKIIQ